MEKLFSIQFRLIVTLLLVQHVGRSQSFFPTWTGVSTNMHINTATNVLQKTSGSNGWNCGARSVEVLKDTSNGWIEIRHSLYNKNSANCGVGFASTNPDHGIFYMAQCLRILSTTVEAYESGRLLATSSISVNDVLRLSKVGHVVYYQINGTTFATDTIGTLVDYFVDTGIRNNSCHIHGLTCSFGSYKTHAWAMTENFTHASGQLTRTGSSAAIATSKNIIPPDKSGFIEFKVDTAHKHTTKWYWGLSSNEGAYTNWEFAVSLKANSDSASFYKSGTRLTTISIANNDKLELKMMGDQIWFSKNRQLITTADYYDNTPLIFMVSSPASSGANIYDSDFKVSFDSTNKFVFTDVTAIGDTTDAQVSVKAYGFDAGMHEYVWSEDYVSREDFEDAWNSLSDSVRTLLDSLSYDEAYATSDSILKFQDPGLGAVWYYDSDLDTTLKSTFRISNALDIQINSGYNVVNNVISKSTTSTGRLILKNGSIPDCRDGEISFQVFQASGTLRIGFSAIGSTANSGGTHMSHYFVVASNAVSPAVGSTNYNLFRSYAYGDILTIRIIGNSMQFLINEVVVHTHTLSGTENLQAEIFYVSNPTTNKTFVKIPQHTLTNVLSGGKTLTLNVNHVSCDGENLGSAGFNFEPTTWSSATYHVRNLADNSTFYNGSQHNGWTNLIPGNYSVVINSGIVSLGIRYFKVGYQVDWKYLAEAHLTETGTGSNRKLNHTDSGTIDAAVSKNILNPDLSGWISWEYRNQGPSGVNKFVKPSFRTTSTEGSTAFIRYKPTINARYGVTGSACNNPSFGFQFESNYKLFEIDWDNTSAKFYKSGVELAYGCAIPIGSEYKMFEVLFNGTTSSIKNAACSFPCGRKSQVAIPKRKLDGGIHLVADGELKFKYLEEYNSDNLQFRIFNCQDMSLPVLENELEVANGDNRESIDVSGLAAGYYIIELKNTKEEKWFLRFHIL